MHTFQHLAEGLLSFRDFRQKEFGVEGAHFVR